MHKIGRTEEDIFSYLSLKRGEDTSYAHISEFHVHSPSPGRGEGP